LGKLDPEEITKKNDIVLNKLKGFNINIKNQSDNDDYKKL